MELINLKYCIFAKNENTELDKPCDCYRYYIDVAYNFKAYRITFCKHWKDYLFNTTKEPELKFGKGYCYKTINQEVLSIIMSKAGIYLDDPTPDLYNAGKRIKDIKSGEIFFEEPIFTKKRISQKNIIYNTDRVFLHKIKASAFYKKLIELYSFDLEKNPNLIIDNYSYLNPYDPFKSRLNYYTYDYYLNEFREKIIEVNRIIEKRAKTPVAKELENLITLTIKEKRK